MIRKSIIYGSIWSLVLLGVYFGTIILISGFEFTLDQFFQFWYFVISLAIGFGIQVGLYIYLKSLIQATDSSGKVIVISGATSTGAMISCCAHYLVNILPVIGVTGFVSIISQYQIEFFWVGLFFNILGILYIGRKVIKLKQA